MTWTVETAIATTSGTAHDFTGIPADTEVIKIPFDQVSLDGTDNVLVQLGDAGGFETSGYSSHSLTILSSGQATGVTSTNGFVIRAASAGVALSGEIVLTRLTGNRWTIYSVIYRGSSEINLSAGSKALSAELTQVRITRTGTNSFDGGSVGCLHDTVWRTETAVSLSGTEHDFVGIPAGTDVIKIPIYEMGTSAGSPRIQLGDSGGIEDTGYVALGITITDEGLSGGLTVTDGFIFRQGATSLTGEAFLSRLFGNIWICHAILWGPQDASVDTIQTTAGYKELSGALTQVRLTINGTATFSGGQANCVHL